MNRLELEKYLWYTSAQCHGIALYEDPTIEEPTRNWHLKHPTKIGELVGEWDYAHMTFRFAASFVQECFEASKGDVNPLRDYMMKHFPRM